MQRGVGGGMRSLATGALVPVVLAASLAMPGCLGRDDEAGYQAPLYSASHPVPRPFEPVRVSDAGAGEALVVSVWGRRYDFESGPLPSRIETQGEDLWLLPPRFELAGSASPVAVSWEPTQLVERAPDRALLSSRGSAGPFALSAQTTVEFDGMIRVDLEVASEAPATLGAFSYTLTVPERVARYYTRHLEYDYAQMRARKAEILAAAGAFPKRRTTLPFVPSLSVGNREIGLEWWSETNVGWAPGGDPIVLEREGGGARLRVAPIAHDVGVSSERPWSHTFALFPMPLRPPPAASRSVRFGSPQLARTSKHDVGNRYVWIAFPGKFEAKWHGLPASENDREQARLRARLTREGISYIPYGKLTAVPSLHPHALQNSEAWAATDRPFTHPPGGERRFLETKGWKKGTPFGFAACAEAPGYLDWMLEENLAAFRAEKLDGLYFDIGGILEPCRRQPYVSDPRREQRWSYFAVRDFYKRLYTTMHAERPDALLTIHTAGQPRALAGFVDFMFVGEALNFIFRDGRPFRVLAKSPDLYDPDYFALPPAFLEALLWPRVGGVTSLLPQVRRGALPRDPQRLSRRTRELLALTLVDDMHVFASNMDAGTSVPVYRALDRFGNLDEARFVPWWGESRPVRHDAPLHVSAYVKGDEALLVVANWEDRAVEATLEVDANALGLGRVVRARDLERSGGTLRLEKGRFHTIVRSRDFRLYRIQ